MTTGDTALPREPQDAIDLSGVPEGQRDAIAARIAAIREYDAQLPPRKGGRVALADRAASSLGISRTQFYALATRWRATGDPARMGDRTGVPRGTDGIAGTMDPEVLTVLEDEIARASEDDTDVEIRRRVEARLPGARPPSNPTIARHRRRLSGRAMGDRIDEMVEQVLALSDALRSGVADLPPRSALRAARHLARHKQATLLRTSAEEVDMQGVDAVLRRVHADGPSERLLVLVTGVGTRQHPAFRALRSALRANDIVVPSR